MLLRTTCSYQMDIERPIYIYIEVISWRGTESSNNATWVCTQKNRHTLCKAKCSHALMAALNEIRSAIREPAWLRKLKANCQLDDFSSDLAMAERLGVWEELICSHPIRLARMKKGPWGPWFAWRMCWCNWPISCNPVLYLLHPSKQSR